jgi:hypothetical protein
VEQLERQAGVVQLNPLAVLAPFESINATLAMPTADSPALKIRHCTPLAEVPP